MMRLTPSSSTSLTPSSDPYNVSVTDDDEMSQSSSSLYSEEPFDLYQTRILYLFSRIINDIFATSGPPRAIRRRGGANHRVTELSVSVADADMDLDLDLDLNVTRKYIWRTPRWRSNDVTRSALILRHLQLHTRIPVPSVLSFSATDMVLADRYILMNLLPGLDLASVLNHAVLSLRQRLEMAESVAELFASVHAIKVSGGEGLIGNVCEENGEADERDHLANGPPLSNQMAHLIIKTFPHDHLHAHDSASSPNASDQSLPTPQTLRSFILGRFRLHLEWARQKDSEWLERIYSRLLVVAQTLLDPDRLPALDVVCKSVVVHTDLMARNILVRFEGERHHDVQVDGDRVVICTSDGLDGDPKIVGVRNGCRDETWTEHLIHHGPCQHPICFHSTSYPVSHAIKAINRSIPSSHISSTDPAANGTFNITGVLDWDDTEALPPLAAYISPNWLWRTPHPDLKNGSITLDDESDPDPDEGIEKMDPSDALVRKTFIVSIERWIPGYMETIRRGRRFGIKRLMGFARSRVRCSWEEEGVGELEVMGEKMKR